MYATMQQVAQVFFKSCRVGLLLFGWLTVPCPNAKNAWCKPSAGGSITNRMPDVVMHHPRTVELETIYGCDPETRKTMRCEESYYGWVCGMLYAERNRGPWSEPCATPIMHAWLKDNVEVPDDCTLVFPQCGSGATEVALLRLLLADGLRVRQAIFMDHVMELIDVGQFADLDAPAIHLFRRYKHLNEFLSVERPANLVVIGIHARMFIHGFPFDDYAEFCRICGDLCATSYVNMRHLSYVEDYYSFNEFSGERIVHESDPTVVVRSCSWQEEMQDAVRIRDARKAAREEAREEERKAH